MFARRNFTMFITALCYFSYETSMAEEQESLWYIENDYGARTSKIARKFLEACRT